MSADATISDRGSRITQLAIIAPTLTAVGTLGFGTVDQAAFGAGAGFVWSFLAWYAFGRLRRSRHWHAHLANLPLLVGLIACSMMWGAGLLSDMQQRAAIDASPQLLTTLLADPLGGPLTGVFIVLNTLMEFVVLPAAICWNWHRPARRYVILAGALVFYAARVWTYLYFAPVIFDTTEAANNATLSSTEVEVFREWLDLNVFRIENQVIIVASVVASLLSTTERTDREPTAVTDP